MLPFLKKKSMDAGLIVQNRAPDQQPQENEEDQGLMSAASDIMSAIESKDHKRLAAAIKAAFEICDSMPHDESEPDETNEEMQ
jgi:CHASE3 domain sensor protein